MHAGGKGGRSAGATMLLVLGIAWASRRLGTACASHQWQAFPQPLPSVPSASLSYPHAAHRIDRGQTPARTQEDGTESLQWFLEDRSTNGTFLNGQRVRKGERVPFQVGDIIRLSTPPNPVLE